MTTAEGSCWTFTAFWILRWTTLWTFPRAQRRTATSFCGPVTMSFQTHTYAQARAIVDALSESENMNQISDLSIRTNQGQDRDLVQTDLVITYFEVAS